MFYSNDVLFYITGIIRLCLHKEYYMWLKMYLKFA